MTQVQSNGIGMTRYAVEYLDWKAGEKLMNARKGDDPNPGLWDYVDQGEIEVRHPLPDKDAAFKWAKAHTELDVFNMPRIVESTLVRKPGDRRHNPATTWERTGYWEVDGDDILEIEG